MIVHREYKAKTSNSRETRAYFLSSDLHFWPLTLKITVTKVISLMVVHRECDIQRSNSRDIRAYFLFPDPHYWPLTLKIIVIVVILLIMTHSKYEVQRSNSRDMRVYFLFRDFHFWPLTLKVIGTSVNFFVSRLAKFLFYILKRTGEIALSMENIVNFRAILLSAVCVWPDRVEYEADLPHIRNRVN